METAQAPVVALALRRPEFKIPDRGQKIDVAPGFEDSGVESELYPSPIWKEPGEQVWGVYLGHREILVERKVRKIYLIRQDDWTTISVWDTTVLGKQMTLKLPMAGDRIIIVYVGEGRGKAGQSAPHILRVGVKRRAEGNGTAGK